MADILIIEDEIHINDLISKSLSLTGHICASAYDGVEAVKVIQQNPPDLIILDVMLPGISGFDLIKLAGDIPVIFVTAKTNLEDKLRGLSLGAEDYIVKPFEMQELIARVNVVLRRFKREDNSTINIDGLSIDLNARKVYSFGNEIELTPKEYSLLEVMIRNKNIALSREKILELVWEYDYEGGTRTVDVHIQLLRQKLGLKDKIKTIYKVGYRFEI